MNEIPERMWMHLMVDFITKLPLVAVNDAILVVCNRLLKMTHFVATTEEMIAEGWQDYSETMCGNYMGY